VISSRRREVKEKGQFKGPPTLKKKSGTSKDLSEGFKKKAIRSNVGRKKRAMGTGQRRRTESDVTKEKKLPPEHRREIRV